MWQFLSDNLLFVMWIITGLGGTLLRASGRPVLVAAGTFLEAMGADLPKMVKGRSSSQTPPAAPLTAIGLAVGLGLAALSMSGCASLGGTPAKVDDAVSTLCRMQPAKLAIVHSVAREHSVPVEALVDVVCAGQELGDSVDVDTDALLAAHQHLVDALKRLERSTTEQPTQ